jgi:threonine/homoserine/homoserine lactone efflux protein
MNLHATLHTIGLVCLGITIIFVAVMTAWWVVMLVVAVLQALLPVVIILGAVYVVYLLIASLNDGGRQ